MPADPLPTFLAILVEQHVAVLVFARLPSGFLAGVAAQFRAVRRESLGQSIHRGLVHVLSAQAERVSATVVAEELAGGDPPLVLDIRNPREWTSRHIAGSVNIPLNHLRERLDEIPRGRRLAVHCAGGYRSSIAAGILHQYGLTHLVEMAGGLAAWEAAQLPVISQT